MTPEQIEKWAIAADEAAREYSEPSDDDFELNLLTEFARLVAQDAWARAAKMCDDMVKRSHSNAAVLIAAAENIRAAAAQEAK